MAAVERTANVAIKTVILYARKRVRQQTLDKIAEAKDGELIAVDQNELGYFEPLTIMTSSAAKASREKAGR